MATQLHPNQPVRRTFHFEYFFDVVSSKRKKFIKMNGLTLPNVNTHGKSLSNVMMFSDSVEQSDILAQKYVDVYLNSYSHFDLYDPHTFYYVLNHFTELANRCRKHGWINTTRKIHQNVQYLPKFETEMIEGLICAHHILTLKQYLEQTINSYTSSLK